MEPKTVYRITGGLVALGSFIIGMAAFASGGSATVTGKVTMLGRPVIWGSVILYGPDGRSAAGRIEPDGSYTVQNAPIGEVIVTVTSPDPLVQHYATQIRTQRERIPVSQWPAPPVDRKQWFIIPKRYESAGTTDLKVPVKRGTNPYDVTLQP
jgi:hypothetical protein